MVQVPTRDAKPLNIRLYDTLAVSLAWKSTTLIWDSPRDNMKSMKLA